MSTHSMAHVAERGFVGLLGSALVVVPAMITWWNAQQVPNTPPGFAAGFGVTLVIAWVLAMYAALRDPDPNWVGVFFKSVGWPGAVMSAGQIFQLPI